MQPNEKPMTKTYTQVMKQIDSLKAEAEKLRRKEIDGVVTRIREAISHYGLTAADLGLSGGAPRAARKAAAKKRSGARRARSARSAAPVKYRDEAGHTWVGIGKRPQWVRDALAAGKSLDEFKVG